MTLQQCGSLPRRTTSALATAAFVLVASAAGCGSTTNVTNVIVQDTTEAGPGTGGHSGADTDSGTPEGPEGGLADAGQPGPEDSESSLDAATADRPIGRTDAEPFAHACTEAATAPAVAKLLGDFEQRDKRWTGFAYPTQFLTAPGDGAAVDMPLPEGRVRIPGQAAGARLAAAQGAISAGIMRVLDGGGTIEMLGETYGTMDLSPYQGIAMHLWLEAGSENELELRVFMPIPGGGRTEPASARLTVELGCWNTVVVPFNQFEFVYPMDLTKATHVAVWWSQMPADAWLDDLYLY